MGWEVNVQCKLIASHLGLSNVHYRQVSTKAGFTVQWNSLENLANI